MAAIPGIKYDDDLPGYSTNSFPVRTLLRHDIEAEDILISMDFLSSVPKRVIEFTCMQLLSRSIPSPFPSPSPASRPAPSPSPSVESLVPGFKIHDFDGAWLVAHRAEQRKRFKAILCTKPKTYARIKEERRRAEKQGTTISEQNLDDQEEEEKEVPSLDGFFMMRHCCVEDPSDLCSVNISGKEMSDVKEEDLALFDNVAYVNAGENYLPFEAFRGFPILRELEMPLNGLRSIKPNLGDYPSLEVLDLSYNNLSHEDVLTLGLLANLKVLHLTGNGFKSLPTNMAMPHYDENSKMDILRFAKLEILLLDDNRLEDVSVFAALAGLSSLKHLNLEKNELYYVPMLKSVEGKVVPNDDEKDVRKLRKSAEKGGRSSARGTKSKEATPRRLEKKDTDLTTTEVPKPTPVPNGDSAEGDRKGSDKELNSSSIPPDLLNEDLTDLSRQVTDIDLEKEITLDTDDNKGELGDGSGLPPFPDLRVLNLAYNKIEDEEALLAVAAWPMLVELIIHNNPLTMENSGDPPLLQKFLGERLGIKIKRKKEADIVKPNVEVKVKRSRQVSTIVPKIPKLSVDDLLMLEAPKPPQEPKPEKSRVHSHLDNQKPLPPIPASPTELKPQRSEEGQRSNRERSRTVKIEDVTERDQPHDKQDENAFFMTQVDDQEDEKRKKKEEAPKKQRRKHRKKEKEEKCEDKYKGFEVLLDLEEDPNYSPPKDMQGNIKALKYALGHELVYRDPAARLDRISKPVEPYRRTDHIKGPPRVTQGQKKEEMLSEMRDRITTEEAGLDEVLDGGHKMRRNFPDADRLLTEIQRRYNAVRVNSMKEAKDARKMLAGTLKEVKKEGGTRRVKLEA